MVEIFSEKVKVDEHLWRLFIEKRLYNTSPADKGVYCQSLCSSGYGNCECLFSRSFARTEAFHGHVQINSTTAIWSSSFDLRHFTDFLLLSTEKGLDNESVIRPSVTWKNLSTRVFTPKRSFCCLPDPVGFLNISVFSRTLTQSSSEKILLYYMSVFQIIV